MFTKVPDRVVTAPATALSAARSVFFRTALIAALAGGVIGISASPALAHSPSSGSTTSSLSLTNADPNFGGTVAFNVTYPAMRWTPELSVACSQNGQTVYLDVHVQDGTTTWTQFLLWSQTWANNGGGSASCVANLYYYTWQGKTETGVVVEAQTSFVTS